MRVLVVYGSSHGHTAKIAARIARTLEGDGAAVAVHEAGDAPNPRDFDAAVVGGSIHGGRHQQELVDWAERHRTALGAMPSAFFSVCLTAADDTEESRAATRAYLDDFVERTGWTPDRMTTFAGALQYRAYDFPTRLVMRLLMARGGHPTDTSHDYDYTDWDAVDAFARSCVTPRATRGRG